MSPLGDLESHRRLFRRVSGDAPQVSGVWITSFLYVRNDVKTVLRVGYRRLLQSRRFPDHQHRAIWATLACRTPSHGWPPTGVPERALRALPLQLLSAPVMSALRAPRFGGVARAAARPALALPALPRGLHSSFGASDPLAVESQAVRRSALHRSPRGAVQPAGGSRPPRSPAGCVDGTPYLGQEPRPPSARPLPGHRRRHHRGRLLEVGTSAAFCSPSA